MKPSLFAPRSNVIPFPRREPPSETRLKSAPPPPPVDDEPEATPDLLDELLLRRSLSRDDQMEAERFANEVQAEMRDLVRGGMPAEQALPIAWGLASEPLPEDFGHEDPPVLVGPERTSKADRGGRDPSVDGVPGDPGKEKRAPCSRQDGAKASAGDSSASPRRAVKTSGGAPPAPAGPRCARAELSVVAAGPEEATVLPKMSALPPEVEAISLPVARPGAGETRALQTSECGVRQGVPGGSSTNASPASAPREPAPTSGATSRLERGEASDARCGIGVLTTLPANAAARPPPERFPFDPALSPPTGPLLPAASTRTPAHLPADGGLRIFLGAQEGPAAVITPEPSSGATHSTGSTMSNAEVDAKILEALAVRPLSQRALAAKLDIGRRTIRLAVNRMTNAGRLHPEGNGSTALLFRGPVPMRPPGGIDALPSAIRELLAEADEFERQAKIRRDTAAYWVGLAKGGG